MGDEGGGHGGGGHGAEAVVAHGGPGGHGGAHNANSDPLPSIKTDQTNTTTREEDYPMSPRIATPNPFSRKNTSLDLDDYFVSRIHVELQLPSYSNSERIIVWT